MENQLKDKWAILADKQSWLRKSAEEYLSKLNETLPKKEAEGRIEYILKTWEHSDNDYAPSLKRKITVDLQNGQIQIWLSKQDYDGKWEHIDKNINDLEIATIRLMASKMAEILTFFENKIEERNGKLDEAIAIFKSYKVKLI